MATTPKACAGKKLEAKMATVHNNKTSNSLSQHHLTK
jgi:hypothetical protein